MIGGCVCVGGGGGHEGGKETGDEKESAIAVPKKKKRGYAGRQHTREIEICGTFHFAD